MPKLGHMPGLILISSSLLSHPLRVRHHRDKYPFDDLIIAVIRQRYINTFTKFIIMLYH